MFTHGPILELAAMLHYGPHDDNDKSQPHSNDAYNDQWIPPFQCLVYSN